MTGLIANSTTILVVYSDRNLQTPMYLFLCNLSIIDICYTTSTVPKLLHMLLTGDYTLSFTQCFVQMFFFLLAAATEDLLLFIMAYDRYVAICNPLLYHQMLSKKICILLTAIAWVIGCINSVVVIFTAYNLPLCSNTIPQFLCDFNAFTKLSCTTTGLQLFSLIETVIFGFAPFLCSLISYTRVISVILSIKSSEGRRKAFSTCSSHLIVLTIYFSTWMSVYILPATKDSLKRFLLVQSAVITPMLNPMIYSVRNKDVKRALLKLVGGKVRGE
ncbi:olfactory receptor 2K2-like [Leptodactylus fuscus]|uniref:olfactory receptor 2K2-like n=1 Tax=Leptodactylus fuscus TaxID=238119 RepID=UPI003F4EB8FF